MQIMIRMKNTSWQEHIKYLKIATQLPFGDERNYYLALARNEFEIYKQRSRVIFDSI
jgi:hypothetical protein